MLGSVSLSYQTRRRDGEEVSEITIMDETINSATTDKKEKKKKKKKKNNKKNKPPQQSETTAQQNRASALSKGEDHFVDEYDRCFCTAHSRASCHVCCLDFQMINEMMEEDNGLRKKKTPIEQLCEERQMCVHSLQFRFEGQSENDEMRVYTKNRIKELDKELAALKATNADVHKASKHSQKKLDASDADMAAVLQAWKKDNPGKSTMEWGGEESQRYFDAVAATPSEAPKVDRFTCLFCKKASATRLKRCSRCERAYFCDAECMRAAWKQHKKVCQPVEGYSRKGKKKKATLTWNQLEKHFPAPVEGRTLEVRIMLDESMMRLVVKAKDREGVVCRIAAYTDSRQIPGCVPGAVMKWKNPRFHYFMDGSSGCRIEQDDLSNITFGD